MVAVACMCEEIRVHEVGVKQKKKYKNYCRFSHKENLLYTTGMLNTNIIYDLNSYSNLLKIFMFLRILKRRRFVRYDRNEHRLQYRHSY